SDRLDLLLLEGVVGGDAVLEVEVGVVAAALKRGREQALGDRGVDRELAAGGERGPRQRGRGVSGHGRVYPLWARPSSRSRAASTARAASRISASRPPSQTR